MHRSLPVLCLLALVAAGCTEPEPTWYEDRCLRIGFARGTPEFNDCIARDRAWIEADQARARETVAGP